MTKTIKIILFSFWIFYLICLQFIFLEPWITGEHWASYFFWFSFLATISIVIAFTVKAIIKTDTTKNKGFSFFLPFAIAAVTFLVLIIINNDIISSLNFDKFPYIWHSLIYLCKSLGITALFFIVLYVLGKKCLKFFKISNISPVEETFISVGLGTGILIYVTFFLSVLHIAYPSVVYFLFAVITLICLTETKQAFIKFFNGKRVLVPTDWGLLECWTLTLMAMIATLALIYSLANLANARFDTLAFYLTVPKIYAENHGLVPFLYNPLWGMPQGAEMIYLLGILLNGVNISFIMNYVFVALSLFVFYLILKSLKLKNAIWMIGIFLSIPLLLTFMTGYLKADSILCFFLLTTILLLQKWLAGKDERMIPLLAIFCGLLVIIKVISLVFVCGIFIFVLVFQKEAALLNWRKIFRVALIIVAIFLPWGIKNLVYYQQPFYPFLQGNDVFTQKIGISCVPYLNQTAKEDRLFTQTEIPSKKSQVLSNILLTTKLFSIQQGISINNPGPWFLILLPPLIIFLIKRKDRDLFVRVIETSSFFYFIFWMIFLSGIIWYLLPALLGFLIITAVMLCEKVSLKSYLPIKFFIPIWLLGVLFILFTGGNFEESIFYIRGENNIQKTLELNGKKTMDGFYESSYKMPQYVNANILERDGHKIIYTFIDSVQYYFEKPENNIVPDSNGYLSYCFIQTGNILNSLKKMNVGYIIDSGTYSSKCLTGGKMARYKVCQTRKLFEQFIAENAKLIHNEGDIKLYSIK